MCVVNEFSRTTRGDFKELPSSLSSLRYGWSVLLLAWAILAILLIFIVVHMSNFWAQYHWGKLPYARYEMSLSDPTNVTFTPLPFDGKHLVHSEYVDAQKGTEVVVAKDLYQIVTEAFQQWWYVALYVLSMIAMGFHLYHGFQSGFQTLGWDHSKYKPAIDFLGLWVFSIIIPALFAAMPLYFLLFK